MRPAAELGVHHMPVRGSQVVTADPEISAQQASERQVETTVHTLVRSAARHLRVGAVVTVAPALYQRQPGLPAEHPQPAQPEFRAERRQGRVLLAEVTRYQARIIRIAR